ncbi:hypothetical protein ASF53_03870 [Methylobacterium sp. Leaf123]|uniref:hypothetical protein n=1 Tax=Methylobacterium sp. Leaf123 TaxID=1736264 RepID=UPI0007019857|nr:hypothetical protein [Methylobacterium sp. Leaf123]KQQ23493.1 hypothetical protein ASF53_03870 [Methylobacterium sp. Leaf123]
MAAVLAFLLFLPVPLLLGLGSTGTCSQNDTDPFLTGACLSLPFVAGSFGLAWRSARRTRAGLGKGHLALIGLPSLALAGLAALVILMNAALVRDTLLLGLSPCGADHTEARFQPERVLIGGLYGLPPLAVLVTALNAVRAALHGGLRRG